MVGPTTLRLHVSNAIKMAKVEDYPWPHCTVTNVFPLDYYNQILKNLPERSIMEQLNHKMKVRYLYWLANKDEHIPKLLPFWQEFRDLLMDELWDALEEKLGVLAVTNGCELVHDLPGYRIRTHTDTADKLVTCLFYLPSTADHSDQGTVLYSGEVPDMTGKGKIPGHFEKIKTIPYLPNTGLFFKRTDWSYHGVGVTPVERWSLAYDLFR